MSKKIVVNKQTIIDAHIVFLREYGVSNSERYPDPVEKAIDHFTEMLNMGDDGEENFIVDAVKEGVSSIIKKGSDFKIFVDGKISLQAAVETIGRMHDITLNLEGSKKVRQLRETMENFPELLSEDEFHELAEQHVDSDRFKALFVGKTAFMVLWHQAAVKGFGV